MTLAQAIAELVAEVKRVPSLITAQIGVWNGQVQEMLADVESWKSGVIKSGENANGRWIKFSDGTLICYMTNSGNLDDTYYVTLVMNFPLPFINNEYSLVSQSTKVAGGNALFGYQVVNREPTSAMVTYITNDAAHTTGLFRSETIVIGRWK